MSRWRRRRGPALLVALVVLVPVLGVLLAQPPAQGALDPDSPAPQGARAVAELLREQGLDVERVERVSAAGRALGRAGPGGATLVVTGAAVLDPDRLADLAADAGHVVLLEPDAGALAAVAPAVRPPDEAGEGAGEEPLVPDDDPVAAGCADPAARAAGTATGGVPALRRSADPAAEVDLCFGGSYAVVRDAGRTTRVLAQGAVVSNERLAESGNAALALRSLGAVPDVVWLVGSPLDAAAADVEPSVTDLLPPWVRWVALQLLLAAVAAAVWRGRRLGPLVEEPLPVVVRSSETAEGRAALYRASRDRPAAARALRAGALWRLAERLGQPPATPPQLVVAAAAEATGRPRAELERLLRGPEPDDDAALVALARGLADLTRPGATGATPTRGPQR